MSGCGDSLSDAERAELDPYITKYGRFALLEYLKDWNGDIVHVKYLVSKGAYVANIKDELGRTPLAVAVGGGKSLEIAKFLISKGADVNAKGYRGETLLHNAGATWATGTTFNIEIVKFLVSHGADVNAKDDGGLTPLHCAATNGSDDNDKIEILKFLVSHGADVNAKDDKGLTPLHYAAGYYDVRWRERRGERMETIKFLISNGADVNAKDDGDKTPLDYAKEAGRTETVNYLSGR